MPPLVTDYWNQTQRKTGGVDGGTVGDEPLEPLEELIESMRQSTPVHTPVGAQRRTSGHSSDIHRVPLLGSPASRASAGSFPPQGEMGSAVSVAGAPLSRTQ